MRREKRNSSLRILLVIAAISVLLFQRFHVYAFFHNGIFSFRNDTVPQTQEPLSDIFLGKIRATAKTSFSSVTADTFSTIDDLRATLASDEYMHVSDAQHNDSPRTPEENRNVVIKDVYVFGIKREDDNDYHLILGSKPETYVFQNYMTAEISGLPSTSSSSYTTLKTVRDIFKTQMGVAVSKELVYYATFKNPPIHLTYIGGSLFFDNHHYGQHSRVEEYQVCSSWEIHPVTTITFAKQQ
ncbi:MAG: hypothetical protein HY064_10775 [Bacteroidetes bacterium]|nr:hypothetical protein [Bacteroidota bacterium]